MKTILLATDLTPAGNNALNWARMLTKHYQATLHLVHVHSPNAAVPVVPGVGAAVALDTIPMGDDGLAREQLTELAEQMAKLGIPVQVHYRAGNVNDEIRAVARHVQANLIITGRQSMDSFLDRLLGSTATGIAQEAACPVLVVPATENDQPARLKKVIFATQLEGNDKVALQSALELASHAGAGLTLLHVEAENQPNLFDDALALDELRQEFGQESFAVQTVSSRTVSGGLNNYLDEHPADLLVMTTRERGFLDGLLSPSLTGRMLTHSVIPVLVYQG